MAKDLFDEFGIDPKNVAPKKDLFDEFGVAPPKPEEEGPLAAIWRQGVAGAKVELPQMLGQAMQYPFEPGSKIYEAGKGIADAAAERAKLPENAPIDETKHNAVVNNVAKGARMVAQSVAPALAIGGAAALAPESLAGAGLLGLASAAGALPAALSQGQQTLEKLRGDGVPEEEAKQAARINAGIELGGETIGNFVGGRVFGAGAKALSKARVAGDVIENATAPSVLKPWLRATGEAALVEPATEFGQNYGETAVENAYGAKNNPTAMESGVSAIAPTLGMTALLAPFGLIGHAANANASLKRTRTLEDAETDPEQRMQIANTLHQELAAIDPEAATNFLNNVLPSIENNQPLKIDESVLAPPDTTGADKTNADLGFAADQYDSLVPGEQKQLGYVPSVVQVPTQDGGTTTIDRNTGPLSSAAVDVINSQIQTGMPLRAYASPLEAQAALDQRPDGDRMRIAPHPRASGRYAVVPKTTEALTAMDRKAEAQVKSEERLATVESEDGNASQVATTGGQGSGTIAGGSAGDLQSVGSVTGGRSDAAGASAASRGTDTSLGDASVGDAALDELAPAPVQPISSMPAAERVKVERQAAARAEAQARGAQLTDDEVASANTAPTEAQQAAGNYQKGHVKIGSLDISIENPAGSVRSGKEGKKSWSVQMSDHYGYIKRTEGADGEQVDVYVKAGTATDHNGPVFVVDQYNPKTGQFDEHKAFVGYRTALDVTRAYDAHFSDGTGPKRRKGITKMAPDAFTAWARHGDTSQAADKAQAEIAQSTGKESKKRSNGDLYQAAAEANKRKQTRQLPTEQNDTLAVREATGADVSVVSEKDLPEADAAPAGHVSRQTAEFSRHVAKLFGKRVVFVEGMPSDGFYNHGNTIYLSTTGSVHHLRLLGHEMLHALRSQSKETYAKLLGAVRGVVTDAQLKSQFRDYFSQDKDKKDWTNDQITEWLADDKNRDLLTEEWMADLSGNRWTESGFWEDVFTQVENKYGSEQAKGIIAKLRLALVTALNKLKTLVRGSAFAVDGRVAEQLDQIRAALATGFADYAKAVKDKQTTEGIGDVKFAKSPGSDIGHKRNSDGRYVGSPDWVGSSPSQITLLRKKLHGLAIEGEPGRMWYERSSKAILELVKGNKTEAEKIVQLIAIYSPSNAVPGNTTMAIKAYYQWKQGLPIRVGTTNNDKKANDLLYQGKEWSGIKTNSFYQNLMQEIDPSKNDTGKATMDMWMALAFDYGMKTVDQGPKYGFMEREIQRLARELGWTPHQVQAAIWTAMKGRIDPIRGELTAAELDLGWHNAEATAEWKNGAREEYMARRKKYLLDRAAGKKVSPPEIKLAGIDTLNADRKKDHYKLAHKMGMEYDLRKSDIEESKYDFSDAIKQRTAQMSWEATPGKSTMVLPGIHDAPMWQQMEYLAAMQKAFSDADGNDIIGKEVGLAMAESVQGFSGWQGASSIGIQDGIVVPPNSQEGGLVQGVARDAINLVADIRGLVLNQEGVAWHYPIYTGSKNALNGIDFNIGRLLTEAENANLYQALIDELGHTFSPPIPSQDGQGFRVLNFPDEKFALMGEFDGSVDLLGLDGKHRKTALQKSQLAKNEAFRDAVHRAVAKQPWLGDVVDHARFETDGELRENDWSNGDSDYRGRIAEAVSGSAFQGANRWAGRSDIFEWIDNDLRPKANAVNSQFAQKYGWAKQGEFKFSTQRSDAPGNGRDGSGNARTGEEVRGYGTAAPGAVTVQGTHYSKQERANLDGRYYGTGMRGAEGPRVQAAADPRLKERVYFYVDKGTGVRPEDGVGSIAHTAQLNNVYDANADTWVQQKVGRELSGDAWLNAFESSVIDNGFDGYVTDFGTQRAAVLLGRHNVPVTRGKGGVSEAKQAAVTAKRTDLPMGKMTGAEWKKLEPRATELEDDKSYYRDQVRFSPSRFDAIAESFADRARKALANPRNTQPILIHSNTPASMQVLGWSDRKLIVEASELAKIANKPGFETDEKIGGLVIDLARPGAMFWNDKQGSLNILRREDMRGAPALIAVRPGVPMGIDRAHLMVTAHRLENQGALLRKITSGELKPLYLDQANPLIKQAMQTRKYRVSTLDLLAPENLHARASVQLDTSSRLLSEADLVKWEQDNWGDAPKFSPARWYFSPLQRAFEQAPDRVFSTAPQVKAWLSSNASKLGVKQDEIQWSGINDWLDLQGKQKVGKGQVLQYLTENGVQVTEVEKGQEGYDEDNPSLPARAGLFVERVLESRHPYQVGNRVGNIIGLGDTEAEAIADAHSGYPEYWEGQDSTHYGQYVLPGGKNYRELLLTLPEAKRPTVDSIARELFGTGYNNLDSQSQQTARDKAKEYDSRNYSSPHWGEKNILAHVRMNDRTDADGNRVLFIEELQSDWGQAGKKTGFGKPSRTTVPLAPGEYQAFMARMKEAASKELERRTEGKVEPEIIKHVIDSQPLSQVAEWAGMTTEFDALTQRNLDDATPSKNTVIPTAPFVTDTKAWVSLAVKRMIAYAVENGYDKVAFVNGEQSADRYDLSKQVDKISIGKYGEGSFQVVARRGGEVVVDRVAEDAKALEALVGKEIAEKYLAGKQMSFEGLDLKVGGEGMKAFYDKIVPQAVSDVLKKVGGGKLGEVKIYSTGITSQGVRQDGAEWVAYDNAAHNSEVGRFNSRAEAERFIGYAPIKQTGFSITPAMREQVGRGLPLFSLARAQIDVDGVLRSTRNSAGKPIAQTEEGLRNFWRWFGDSKVVDAEGKPLVVYHVTTPDEGQEGIEVFDTGRGELGAHFGTPDQANAMVWSDEARQSSIPVYLAISNPLRLRDMGGWTGSEVTGPLADLGILRGATYGEAVRREGTGRAFNIFIQQTLRKAGYDGIVYLNRREGTGVDAVIGEEEMSDAEYVRAAPAAKDSYIAFRPNQIKSAIGNRGTFDGANPDIRMSLARKVSDAVDSTLGKLDAAVDGLSNLPDQFDYLRDRYLALGKIARVDEISTEVRKAFDGAAPADKQAVYDYLTTRGATTGRISDHKLRSIAKRIKDTINYTGDQLVARGLLDQEARDHYRDQYLPRMYLRHMLDDQAFKVIGMGKKPSDMGYLKHRKDIPQEIRDVVLGEIKDPSFLSVNAIGRAMRDVSLLDWMGKISQNNDWVFPEIFVPWQGKKVTAYWLRAEADRIENQSTHYTPANKTKADALVAQMRSTAHQALGSMSAIDHKKFKQIPDTRRYGLLRGMWVRTEIYNDIMGASQIVNADPTWFEDWFGFGGKGTRLTQWWKFTKVAANPPGQIRNFISNMVMLQLSGIGLHRLPFALIEAARDITNNGKYWQVAKKYGVTESTFTAQELFRVKRDLVEMEAQKGKLSSLRWLMSAGARFFEGVSDLYQFSEALGKTIKIMEEMKAGKSEAEAAIEAQKWLFDYSLVPQSVRIARNAPVGMPFLCVSDDTEILTKGGWRNADTVKVGDWAATMDTKTGRLTWRLIDDVYRSDYDGEMIHVKDRHLDMLMTPNHGVVTYRSRRVPGKRATGEKYMSLEVVHAENLTTGDHIPVAAPFDHVPDGEPISDALVEVLGWYATEGHEHNKCDAVFISQNEGAKAIRIRHALTEAGITFREDTNQRDACIQFYIHAEHGRHLRALCPGKQLPAGLLQRMSVAQIDLLVQTMIDGDGHTSKNGRQVFIQKDNETLDTFLAALTLIGKSWNVRPHGSGTKAVLIKEADRYCVKRATRDRVQYKGRIWCPEVIGTGTWVARRNGKVFITHNTYQVKVLPRLLEVAAKHPWRFLPWAGLLYGMQAAVASMFGVDDDELKKLKKSLPEWLQDRGHTVFLPFRDADGRLQVADVGYFFPWTFYSQTGKHVADGKVKKALVDDVGGQFSAPILGAAAALMANYDTFTKQPIYKETDPVGYQAAAIANYAYDLMAPPFISSHGVVSPMGLVDTKFGGKLTQALAGTTNRFGDPKATEEQALGAMLGFNFYGMDPEHTRVTNLKVMEFKVHEVEKGLKQRLMDKGLSSEQRLEAIRDYRERMSELQQEMLEYAKESQVPEQLKVKKR